MEEGEEIELLVEFNWNKPGVTKDWSVSVWGEEGAAFVVHTDAISEHFSFTEVGDMKIDQYNRQPEIFEEEAVNEVEAVDSAEIEA